MIFNVPAYPFFIEGTLTTGSETFNGGAETRIGYYGFSPIGSVSNDVFNDHMSVFGLYEDTLTGYGTLQLIVRETVTGGLSADEMNPQYIEIEDYSGTWQKSPLLDGSDKSSGGSFWNFNFDMGSRVISTSPGSTQDYRIWYNLYDQ